MTPFAQFDRRSLVGILSITFVAGLVFGVVLSEPVFTYVAVDNSAAAASDDIGVTTTALPGQRDLPVDVIRDSGLMRSSHSDAGVELIVADERARECARTITSDSTAMIAVARSLQRSAQIECMSVYMQESPPTDPRTPCGLLSEALWNATFGPLGTVLSALATINPPHGDASLLFDDVDCAELSIIDYAAAAQVAVTSSSRVAPEFLQCAITREPQGSPILGYLLDAARQIPAPL